MLAYLRAFRDRMRQRLHVLRHGVVGQRLVMHADEGPMAETIDRLFRGTVHAVEIDPHGEPFIVVDLDIPLPWLDTTHERLYLSQRHIGYGPAVLWRTFIAVHAFPERFHDGRPRIVADEVLCIMTIGLERPGPPSGPASRPVTPLR